MLANRIAFGKIYQSELRQRVEALGYETEVVGKHGMWEMPGVPVEAFSSRSQAIREAVGEDASLKSRDVAALDTRKSKQHVDPEIRMAEWMQTLKKPGSTSGHIVTRRISVRRSARRRPGLLHRTAGCAAGGDTGDCRIK
ncbi:relaxase domain-containing protein [Shigella flexneri]|uniref:relaxase domain-containing protein n=1 Tax=Shigella flexneri TaxID=623 RepID=UPI003C6F3C8D